MSVAILPTPAPLLYFPHPPPLILPISSLSCASGVYSIKLVDLLLAAHPQVTECEIDFTVLILDAVVHMTSNPYAPTPAHFLKKAVQVPDLVRALADSPDLKCSMSDDPETRLVFECLIRRIIFQYCYRELGITSNSYRQAIEYLADRPPELAARHKQYRAGVTQLEQQAANAAVVTQMRKRKTMARSASSMVLSMFRSKKKWLAAK